MANYDFSKNIQAFYKEKYPELIITKRIEDGLNKVILEMYKNKFYIKSDFKQYLNDFLNSDNTINYIKQRQPQISQVPLEIEESVKKYFEQSNMSCRVTEIYRKSNHPDDDYLYSVIGQNENGTYSCWTSWNASTGSLNHGHYGLKTKEIAQKILEKYYYDITDEKEKYGMKRTCRQVEDNYKDKNESVNHKEESAEKISGKVIKMRFFSR